MTAPTPSDTPIQTLDPVTLLEIQAVFGELVHENPRLVKLVNNLAPVLFATLLFTALQEYRESDDGESVEPTKSALEAEQACIGMVRSVAAAFGTLEGDLTIEPSNQEIDQDTEINPVK